MQNLRKTILLGLLSFFLNSASLEASESKPFKTSTETQTESNIGQIKSLFQEFTVDLPKACQFVSIKEIHQKLEPPFEIQSNPAIISDRQNLEAALLSLPTIGDTIDFKSTHSLMLAIYSAKNDDFSKPSDWMHVIGFEFKDESAAKKARELLASKASPAILLKQSKAFLVFTFTAPDDSACNSQLLGKFKQIH